MHRPIPTSLRRHLETMRVTSTRHIPTTERGTTPMAAPQGSRQPTPVRLVLAKLQTSVSRG